MNTQTQTHAITCSLDQPNAMLDSLRGVLQQGFRSFSTLPPTALPVLRGRGVYLIDNNAERARYIASLLSMAGYHPTVVTSTLDAFTHFLQGTFIPIAIIASQEDTNQRFFLNRLTKQMLEKYDWEILFVRLLFQPSNKFLTRITTPLPPLQPPGLFSSSTTRPLSPVLSQSSISSQITAPLTPVQVSPATRSIHPMEGKSLSGVVQEKVPAKKEEKLALEGESLGRYQVHTLLGCGPQCTIYHAYDRMREQDVALKAIPTSIVTYQINQGSTELPNFFQPEADLLANLKHPHILPIVHIGKSYVSGQPFFYKTTPYCSEGSLASWPLQFGSKLFSPQEVLNILLQLADALQYLHDNRLPYQNFKLSNILVRNEAENMRNLHVGLVDFGIEGDGFCYAKTPVNYRYMAPEQFNGESSPASDQYGLAAIIYELLTRRPLFQGTSEQIMKHMHTNMRTQPPSLINPAVSPDLSKVMLRALAKRPDDRFASVAEFAQAFQRYCL
ncbi:MAG TPA: serine/threonine-protein kinase [Ktedonobacteraceae bacterium]|nr:serine/threonine-protein kinase [Ktedonobacteraceae bacterium]